MLETLIRGFTLSPKKVFSDKIYPEVSQIYQNLCAVDDVQALNRLMDAGLPLAVLELLAKYYGRSYSVTVNCLEALHNLINCY